MSTTTSTPTGERTQAPAMVRAPIRGADQECRVRFPAGPPVTLDELTRIGNIAKHWRGVPGSNHRVANHHFRKAVNEYWRKLIPLSRTGPTMPTMLLQYGGTKRGVTCLP